MEPKTTDLDQYSKAYGADFPYARENGLMMQWYARRVTELHPHGTMLELGLGHGHTSRIFANHYDQLTVLDGSPAIIEQFRSSSPDFRGTIVHTYFETFEPATHYDVVVAGFVLEHVDDPFNVVKKYSEVLAPGGSFFIAVPNAEALNRRFGVAAGLLPDLTTLSAADLQLGHQRLFTVKSLQALVRDAGLRVRALEGLFLKPLATSQLEQLKLQDNIYQAMMKVGQDYPDLSVGILLQATRP